jgi:hypothetical protein
MKPIPAIFLATILSFSFVLTVNAQSADSIWLEASNTAYKTGETVTIALHAISATPIQGFTFQIRYDPACLEPINAASPIPGMNGLSLPQTAGLVDASFASTTPQAANGLLAEVQFVTLAGCQTNLTLESAALAIRDASGFAAPLSGMTIGEKSIALNIDKAVGESQIDQPLLGTPLPLGPAPTADVGGPGWGTVLPIMLLVVAVIFATMFGVYKLLKR